MANRDYIETQLRDVLQKHNLIPCGGKVLVAVSGGADSVCLLYSLLATMKSGVCFGIEVAHLDHGLRCESATDAQFVLDLCAGLGLVCHVRRIDVKALAGKRKQGIEEAGREARRKFLQRIALETHCDCIALAHHRDDQAETVLLRLTRGCGVSGLSAMRWRDGIFIRPLLEIGRQQIMEYLQECDIAYVEDESNSSLVYARNRVRHKVLPQLGCINPSVSKQLSKLAAVVEVEEGYWQQQVSEVVKRSVVRRENMLRLSCSALLLEHPALCMRVIRSCLEQVRGDLHGIEMVHIDAIAALLQDGRPQRELSLPQVWVARRYDDLVFSAVPPAQNTGFDLGISAPGSFQLPDGTVLKIEIVPAGSAASAQCVEFDASLIQFPLWLRSVKAGDRISCNGMSGRKKIKKIFAEKRFELEQRQSALVLGWGQEILWLLGLCRCSGYGVEPGDAAVLRCKIGPD